MPSYKQDFDKYYSPKATARFVVETTLDFCDAERFVEPSAGDGAIFDLLPENKIGFDIEPGNGDIIKKDFFDVMLNENDCVIGNPPFGFASSLAIGFFNHAASFNVKCIAFILPKTFRKLSVQNKLNAHYHLIYDIDIDNTFELRTGETKQVPVIFQIWIYKDEKRDVKLYSLENNLFDYVQKKAMLNLLFEE